MKAFAVGYSRLVGRGLKVCFRGVSFLASREVTDSDLEPSVEVCPSRVVVSWVGRRCSWPRSWGRAWSWPSGT